MMESSLIIIIIINRKGERERESTFDCSCRNLKATSKEKESPSVKATFYYQGNITSCLPVLHRTFSATVIAHFTFINGVVGAVFSEIRNNLIYFVFCIGCHHKLIRLLRFNKIQPSVSPSHLNRDYLNETQKPN